MEVRPARPGDEPGIATVLVASWEGAYRGIVPTEIIAAMGYERRVEQWRRILAEPPPRSAALVSETATRITGVVMVGPSRDRDGDVGEVILLYVHPAFWGRGHGTALCAAGLDHLRGIGFTTATLWVHRDNELGRSFYERGGWHADGATHDDDTFGAPLPHVRYRIEL
jgi:GNAT superfamily N-acetyltransferase